MQDRVSHHADPCTGRYGKAGEPFLGRHPRREGQGPSQSSDRWEERRDHRPAHSSEWHSGLFRGWGGTWWLSDPDLCSYGLAYREWQVRSNGLRIPSGRFPSGFYWKSLVQLLLPLFSILDQWKDSTNISVVPSTCTTRLLHPVLSGNTFDVPLLVYTIPSMRLLSTSKSNLTRLRLLLTRYRSLLIDQWYSWIGGLGCLSSWRRARPWTSGKRRFECSSSRLLLLYMERSKTCGTSLWSVLFPPGILSGESAAPIAITACCIKLSASLNTAFWFMKDAAKCCLIDFLYQQLCIPF